MNADDDAAGSHLTERRAEDLIATTIVGRVTVSMVREWGAEWVKLQPEGEPCGRVWFFDALRLASYSTDAVGEATRLFMRLEDLRAVVIASRSRVVLLGAAIVRKALRATTGVDVAVVDSVSAAEARFTDFRARYAPRRSARSPADTRDREDDVARTRLLARDGVDAGDPRIE
ncbi:MAG: hypothetical protein U0414_37020 [Polyangiaceae bacterium]